MRITADLHIHSRFSLATSSKLTPQNLDRWARVKGIDLIGTGDCTHPAWLSELNELLEPIEDGFFGLKKEARQSFDSGEALAEELPIPVHGENKTTRFVLTGEISTIYSRDGKTRKIHHVVILPSFSAAEAFQTRLERIGNITSDGRPILGLDSRDLLAMLLDADDRSVLIPAHIWTPWFSALGARSGFESIDECYGDLASHITAIETGLSSNPPMNWAVGSLDRFSIISNSDAHSPEKLGREATVFDMDASFAGLSCALAGGGSMGNIVETIEFFPQEGKYHYDGHRNCGVALSPEESLRSGGLCPVCGKPLTQGVLRRVSELADRPVSEDAPCPPSVSNSNQRPYRSLIPLKELLSELLDSGANSKKTRSVYNRLINQSGNEFSLLLDMGENEIESLGKCGVSGELLRLAITRMRSGHVSVTPGYDGEYGVIRAFAKNERVNLKSVPNLFGEAWVSGGAGNPERIDASKNAKSENRKKNRTESPTMDLRDDEKPIAGVHAQSAKISRNFSFRLDPSQERAVNHAGGPALVIAGPGTGKTAVLARRIARLVENGVAPDSILALTFTNKAAEELRDRIGRTIDSEQAFQITAATFHSFCRCILRDNASVIGLEKDFSIIDEEERNAFLSVALRSAADNTEGNSGVGRATMRRLGAYIEEHKRFLLKPGDFAPRFTVDSLKGIAELVAEIGLPTFDEKLDSLYNAYRDALKAADALDFDDLVAGTVRLFANRQKILERYQVRYKVIFVDEYQDVNFAQYALIRILAPAANRCDLCVIGDPNQAIYGFRGSDRRFIERFLIDYPEAATYRLVRSFRCAPSIIGAAGRLVGTELEGSGVAVTLSRTESPTDKSEAEFIAREIDKLIGGTRFFAIDSGVVNGASKDDSLSSLSECAILIRASALASPIEKALLDHGIPFVVIGEKPWWEDEPVRSVLRLIRGTKKSGVVRDMSAEELVAMPEMLTLVNQALSPRRMVQESLKIFERSLLPNGKGIPEPPFRIDPFDRLLVLADRYRDISSFLDALSLGSSQDGCDPQLERVSIMTIHAAKGLEFDHVFVAGLEEGLLPFTLFDFHGDGKIDVSELDERIEEERRLLYVAMTRARLGLHLSWARARTFRGRGLNLPPSRFLSEIEDLVPRIETGSPRPRGPQLNLF